MSMHDLKHLHRVASAAEKLHIRRTSVQSAVAAGKIPSFETGCGVRLVYLADVESWHKQRSDVIRERDAQSA